MQALNTNSSTAHDEPQAPAADHSVAPRRDLAWLLGPAVEVVAALAGLGWMLLSTRTIYDFHALNRISQVSGEAALQVRFFVPVLLLTGLLLATGLPALAQYRKLAARVALPALPALMSGFVAGGITLALRGTPMPLYGVSGDAGEMDRWSLLLMHGQTINKGYPPLFPRIVATTAELFTHHDVFTAYKYDQIVGTALLGAAAYIAWRLVASRAWSCVLAILAVALAADPYKPYEGLTLAVVIPLSIAYLRYLRRCAERSYWHVAVVGVASGLVLAESFLLFAGWYYWSAAGLAVAAAVVFPWRAGWQRGLLLLGCTAVPFLAVAGQLLIQLIHDPRDAYFYFGTSLDPAYVAIKVGDLPGALANGVWPPPGEIGGVGIYTALVIITLGVAIWLGFRRTAVIAIASMFVGAWLMRFYIASHMYSLHQVNLWPRTTLELQYCFVLLAVYAVMLAASRLQQWAAQHELPSAPGGAARHAAAPTAQPAEAAARQPAVSALVALMLAGALFAGSAASAITNQYMPADNNSLGQLAWNSHHQTPADLNTHVKNLVNGG
jgi:galactan 5-O-arabinofuranosyltransferase